MPDWSFDNLTAPPLGVAQHLSTRTQVLETDVSLRPHESCVANHGKGKAKRVEDRAENANERAEARCGERDICVTSNLWPATRTGIEFRIQTSDPVHDLQRFITMRNQTLEGAYSRDAGFQVLESDVDFTNTTATRFTNDHLREALIFAVDEIRDAHTSLSSLIEYRERWWWYDFDVPVGRQARQISALPMPQDVLTLPRSELKAGIVDMTRELDYLRQSAEKVKMSIFTIRWEQAEEGDVGEIETMLRSGLIFEEDLVLLKWV